MMTFGDLALKYGDRVRDRETGACGTVVRDKSDYEHDAVCVWWDYDPYSTAYNDPLRCDWELIPRPRPLLDSLKLQPGDVVRWEGQNMLVAYKGANKVTLLSSGGTLRELALNEPVPNEFVRVET